MDYNCVIGVFLGRMRSCGQGIRMVSAWQSIQELGPHKVQPVGLPQPDPWNYEEVGRTGMVGYWSAVCSCQVILLPDTLDDKKPGRLGAVPAFLRPWRFKIACNIKRRSIIGNHLNLKPIMSPNYVADRAESAIVTKERWYAPPAKPPGEA